MVVSQTVVFQPMRRGSCQQEARSQLLAAPYLQMGEKPVCNVYKEMTFCMESFQKIPKMYKSKYAEEIQLDLL